MKHKAIYFLTVLFAIVMLTISAFAADTVSFDLDELDMTIALPADYVVFTRDISDSDPNLSAYGLTKDGLYSNMVSNSQYLDGWDTNADHEIIVTMTENTIADLNQYADESLSDFVSYIKSEYQNFGITFIKYEIYKHNQAKFIKIYCSGLNGDSTAYGVQYLTIYASKSIAITMQSYSGEIGDSEENILKSIVDSIKFGTDPQTAGSEPALTPAFQYNDAETGVSFTVPANWSEEPFYEEKEFLEVKFIRYPEEVICIMYGSMDAWSKMSDIEKSLYTRSDINTSLFTKADMAEFLGVSEDDVDLITYSGDEYYRTEITQSASSYGVDIYGTLTYLIHIENGYMFFFQYGRDASSEHSDEGYDDFESLMWSVRYKSSDSTAAASTGNRDLLLNSVMDGNIIEIIIIIGIDIIATIFLYTLPIIIYRYAVRKLPVEKGKAIKITIIYGIAAFIFMSVLITLLNENGAAGGSIILWSFVNYRILISGANKSAGVPSQENEPEAYKDKKVKKLTSDKRCPVCGCYINNPIGVCNACGYMPFKETKESSQVAEIKPNNNSASNVLSENEQPKQQNIDYESPEYITIFKNNIKKYPFNEKAVGSKNPYNGKTILTEKDYFECIMAYSTDEYKNIYNSDFISGTNKSVGMPSQE